MRILWFVNTPFPEMVTYFQLKGDFMGSWMPALKRALLNNFDCGFGLEDQLAIACSSPHFFEFQKFVYNKVTYFCLPKSRICEYLQSYEQELSYCEQVVREFHPDIVHIHGTEEFYGLLTERIDAPVVVSLQGILSAYVRVYFGSMGWREICCSPRIIRHFLMMNRKTRTEKKIFKANRYFIGRTQWDRSHLTSLAHDNHVYYHCDEVMRKAFYEEEWNINDTTPGTIACISSSYAYKGIDCLLEAIAQVKKKLPRVRLHIYGSFPQKGYGAFLQQKVRKLRLHKHVQFCGFKKSRQLAGELKKTRAFVIASHIENSSNSLQEALLMGIPSVVSYAGGLPSLAEHEKTCLMFPRGDASILAECLYRILTEERLAVRIAMAGRLRARNVNNPDTIAQNLLEIYQDIIIRHYQLLNQPLDKRHLEIPRELKDSIHESADRELVKNPC